MSRQARTQTLTPDERNFRLDRWLDENEPIEDKSGSEWVLTCPRCYKPKLAVHVHRKAWQCWTCGFAGWSPTGLVAALAGVPLSTAAEVMAAQGLSEPVGRIEPLRSSAPRRGPLPAATIPLTLWRLLGPQQQYMAARGVTQESAALFGLGTVVGTDAPTKANRALRGRVVFPCWDNSGRFVFWQARAIDGDKVKTLNFPRSCRTPGHHPDCVCYHEEWGLPPVAGAASANEVLVGLHLVRPGDRVVVVEGPVDAAVCGPGFVSPLGARLSPAQAALIAERQPREVVILFDGDDGGRKALAKSVDLMSGFVPCRGATCPPGTDPGDLGRDVVLQLINNLPSAQLPQLVPGRVRTAGPSGLPPLLPPLVAKRRSSAGSPF